MTKTHRDVHRFARAIAVWLGFHLFEYFLRTIEIAGKPETHLCVRRMTVLEDRVVRNQLGDQSRVHFT